MNKIKNEIELRLKLILMDLSNHLINMDPIRTHGFILPNPTHKIYFIHSDPIRTNFRTIICFESNSDAAEKKKDIPFKFHICCINDLNLAMMNHTENQYSVGTYMLLLY